VHARGRDKKSSAKAGKKKGGILRPRPWGRGGGRRIRLLHLFRERKGMGGAAETAEDQKPPTNGKTEPTRKTLNAVQRLHEKKKIMTRTNEHGGAKKGKLENRNVR